MPSLNSMYSVSQLSYKGRSTAMQYKAFLDKKALELHCNFILALEKIALLYTVKECTLQVVNLVKDRLHTPTIQAYLNTIIEALQDRRLVSVEYLRFRLRQGIIAPEARLILRFEELACILLSTAYGHPKIKCWLDGAKVVVQNGPDRTQFWMRESPHIDTRYSEVITPVVPFPTVLTSAVQFRTFTS